MSRPLGATEVDRLERFLEVQANRIEAAPPPFVPPESRPVSEARAGWFDEAWLYRAAVCTLVVMAGLALVVGGRDGISLSETETASVAAGQGESLLVWIRTSRADELVGLASRDDVVAVEWIGIRRDARPEDIEAAWAPYPEARIALQSPDNAAIQPDAYRVTVVEGSSETVQEAIGGLSGHVASLPFPRCVDEPDSIVFDCDIERTSDAGAHLPTPFLGGVLVMLATLTYARLRRFAVAGVNLTVVYAPFAVFLWWFVRPLSAVLRDAAPVLEAIERQHNGALDGDTWHALNRQRFSRTTGDPDPVAGVDPSLVRQLESTPGVDQVDRLTSLFAYGIGPILLFGLVCVLTGLSHSRSRHERAVILLGVSVPVVATAVLLGPVGLGNLSSIAAFLRDG